MVKVEEGKVRTWRVEEILPREGSLSDSGSFSDILRGRFQPKVSPSSSSLITPDIFKLLRSYESSGHPLLLGVWKSGFHQELTK